MYRVLQDLASDYSPNLTSYHTPFCSFGFSHIGFYFCSLSFCLSEQFQWLSEGLIAINTMCSFHGDRSVSSSPLELFEQIQEGLKKDAMQLAKVQRIVNKQ